MMRRLESLSFYLSATECLVEGEASGVVLTRSMPGRLWEGLELERGEEIGVGIATTSPAKVVTNAV